MKPLIYITLSLALCTSAVDGQSARAPEESPAAQAMKKLAFLAGRWEGVGTMMLGPGQEADARVVEVGTFKLQKSVFVIEGTGVAELPDGKKQNVHDAMGIISWDTKAKKFRLRTYRAGGEVLDPEIEVNGQKIVWAFKDPARGNRIRFTITVSEDKWTEVGEVRTGEDRWFRFFEMKLQKKK